MELRPVDTMTLTRLKWGFFLTLVVLFVFVEFSRFQLAPFLPTWRGRLIMDLVILVGSVFFFGAVFDIIARLQQRLERQNRELFALHRAALDIYGEVALETVLQKVVDQAAQLAEARYGAVAIYDSQGQIREFFTSGMTPDERSLVGEPPRGTGLLGVVLRDGQRLRLSDIESDARSAGMPPNHPPMSSLLAVPIVCQSPFRGNLYVTEKRSATEFSLEDEETLVRFATAAAIAIDNAELNRRLRTLAVSQERLRIAREIHDGMAQVLAYVNTKAQAVKAYLQKGRTEEASDQLEQLAGAAREVYTDAREGILALRTEVGPEQPFEDALRQFMRRWEGQSGISARLVVDGKLDLPSTVELQLLRIIQEALSNARKHADAETARVTLARVDDRLLATIEDDGIGFDPSSRVRGDFPRFGLAIMRERAESIGGSMELDSAPGSGTRVKIAIPIPSGTL